MATQKVPGLHQAVAARRSTVDADVSTSYRRAAAEPLTAEEIVRRVMVAVNLAGTSGWRSTASSAPTMKAGSYLAMARALSAKTPIVRSARRVAKKATKGESAQAAVAAGYRRYTKLGGPLDYAPWTRAVCGLRP